MKAKRAVKLLARCAAALNTDLPKDADAVMRQNAQQAKPAFLEAMLKLSLDYSEMSYDESKVRLKDMERVFGFKPSKGKKIKTKPLPIYRGSETTKKKKEPVDQEVEEDFDENEAAEMTERIDALASN